MLKRTAQRGNFSRVAVLLTWLLMSGYGLASDTTIVIIKSSDNPFFSQTIESFINNGRKAYKYKTVLAEEFESSDSADAAAIITLGVAAAELTEDLSSVPVIHSYLTKFQVAQHEEKRNHYSLILEQPLPRYLQFIEALLPGAKVALIRTETTAVDDNRLASILNDSSLTLEQSVHQQSDNPVSLVRRLLRQNDLLLSLPEPLVYNQRTLKGILLSSYRLNKPMISYSPAHVKSGALAAIYTSPKQIGEQLASMLEQAMQPDKSSRGVYYAQQFEISINRRVAASLQLDIPEDEVILTKLREQP